VAIVVSDRLRLGVYEFEQEMISLGYSVNKFPSEDKLCIGLGNFNHWEFMICIRKTESNAIYSDFPKHIIKQLHISENDYIAQALYQSHLELQS